MAGPVKPYELRPPQPHDHTVDPEGQGGQGGHQGLVQDWGIPAHHDDDDGDDDDEDDDDDDDDEQASSLSPAIEVGKEHDPAEEEWCQHGQAVRHVQPSVLGGGRLGKPSEEKIGFCFEQF